MNRDTSLPFDAFDFLWLEVTPHCNLTCTHCYADSSPQRQLHDVVQPADWMALIDEASDLGCRRAQFVGGEPTLYPALGALVDHARSRGFTELEVYTNGTVLTRELKDLFLRCDLNLAFSVYAAQADVHDDITRQRGSWTKTMASIRWALDSGLRVRAAIVAMGANQHEVEDTQRLLRAMGVPRVGVDGIRGIGRGSREVAPESLLNELCGACGRGQLSVSANGQIYPCVFSHFHPVGQFRTGLASALRSARLRAFREAMRPMSESDSAPPVIPVQAGTAILAGDGRMRLRPV